MPVRNRRHAKSVRPAADNTNRNQYRQEQQQMMIRAFDKNLAT